MWQNSECEKMFTKKFKMWQNSNTQNFTKSQKHNVWQNTKTQNVTILKKKTWNVTVVTEVTLVKVVTLVTVVSIGTLVTKKMFTLKCHYFFFTKIKFYQKKLPTTFFLLKMFSS